MLRFWCIFAVFTKRGDKNTVDFEYEEQLKSKKYKRRKRLIENDC